MKSSSSSTERRVNGQATWYSAIPVHRAFAASSPGESAKGSCRPRRGIRGDTMKAASYHANSSAVTASQNHSEWLRPSYWCWSSGILRSSAAWQMTSSAGASQRQESIPVRSGDERLNLARPSRSDQPPPRVCSCWTDGCRDDRLAQPIADARQGFVGRLSQLSPFLLLGPRLRL